MMAEEAELITGQEEEFCTQIMGCVVQSCRREQLKRSQSVREWESRVHTCFGICETLKLSQNCMLSK